MRCPSHVMDTRGFAQPQRSCVARRSNPRDEGPEDLGERGRDRALGVALLSRQGHEIGERWIAGRLVAEDQRSECGDEGFEG